MLNNIYLVIILISYLSSLIAFRLDSPRPIKFLSWFLLLVLVTESLAVAWPRIVHRYNLQMSLENHWVYNIYLIPAYLFYLYFFYQFLKSKEVRKIILISTIIFFLFGISNLFFGQGFFVFNTYTVLVAGFLVVFMTLAYFYQILYDKDIIIIKRDPIFWISSGAFLFHLTTMFGLFFIVFLNNWYAKAAYPTVLIIKFTSMAMYLSYIIAFICLRKA